MFGYLVADANRLSADSLSRYRAFYCGLCHTLREKYGSLGRLALNYDMTFLIILLSSLYEPETLQESRKCAVHPFKARSILQNEFCDYAAAMTVLLSREHCLDDWNDDKNLLQLGCAKLLSTAAEKAKAQYPKQAQIIEKRLAALSELEKQKCSNPDTAANEFGNLMAQIFVYRDDRWSQTLHDFGFSLGKLIFLLDAVCDFESDEKMHRYNPLHAQCEKFDANTFLPLLQLIAGDAMQAFDVLPLVQDAEIMKNILFFGIWTRYKLKFRRKEKEA